MPLWSGKQLGHSCSARLSCFLQNQRNSNVGLAGIIHIQNSVRASKSPIWKQGDRLSIGNGRVLARTTPANQSLILSASFLLPQWKSSRLLKVSALILTDFKNKPGFYLLYVVFVSGVHTHSVAD